MKIGYICSDVDVEVFGSEGCSVHIREFTNALVDAGHDVFALCAWAGGEGGSASARARVRQLDPRGLDAEAWTAIAAEPGIQNQHLDRDLRSVLWNSWLQGEGSEILARERPDFLYERYALFGSGGIQLARRFQIPLLLELNAPLCDQQEGYEKFTLMETARRMEGEILRAADGVVALTDWLRDWAVGLGAKPERIRVIPDAVSGPLFGGTPNGKDVRARHGLERKRVVGFVGSFHWWHDVKGLLHAFSILLRSDPDLRLLLVGGGDSRKGLEKRARDLGLSDAVVFTGKVPHERVPEYIAAMDVAVVPYGPLNDFFFSPLKLFECMAVGRPTVAARLGQIAQVVDHGTTGLLYAPGDAEDLASAISVFLRDPQRAASIGVAAREQILGRHTWAAVTQEVFEMAGDLIRQGMSAGTPDES